MFPCCVPSPLHHVLDVKCTRNASAPAAAPDHDKYLHSAVTTADMVWIPQGRQAITFADRPIAPMYDDIVIAKMRPGQQIEAELHVEKVQSEDTAQRHVS